MRKTVLPLAYQTYRIYKDSARTQEWGGTGFPFGSALSSTAGTAGTVKVFPAYGRTLTPTSTITGSYSDTLLVSVDF
jgi:spore coat protein U-like protein